MDGFDPIILGVVWLAIAALLVWGVVDALRRLLRNDTPLPLFGMLERQGLTLAQAEQVVGINELSHAVRRCALCAVRSECGRRAAFCPNGSLLLRAKVLLGGPS